MSRIAPLASEEVRIHGERRKREPKAFQVSLGKLLRSSVVTGYLVFWTGINDEEYSLAAIHVALHSRGNTWDVSSSFMYPNVPASSASITSSSYNYVAHDYY